VSVFASHKDKINSRGRKIFPAAALHRQSIMYLPLVGKNISNDLWLNNENN